MYAFLLSLGAAITAAGIALVASGVSPQDRAFGASDIMPGIIAILGGCILVGLGLVVRALLRVERALNARAALRTDQAGEASAAAVSDHAGEHRIPFPPDLNTAAAPAGVESPAAGQTPARLSSDKASAAERIESAPVVEAGDASLLPPQPARSDDAHGVTQAAMANGKLNGASHTTSAPPLAGGPGGRPQPKNSIFDALWPKAAGGSVETQPAPAAQPVAVATTSGQSTQVHASQAHAEPSPVVAPASAVGLGQTPASVSILKSGVVEGMAYTLYSDGSIEAQLPGGTVRFASITELRSHIEQNG